MMLNVLLQKQAGLLLQFLFLLLLAVACVRGSFLPRVKSEEGLLSGDLELVPYLSQPLDQDYIPETPFHWAMPRIEKRDQPMRYCGKLLTKFITETCGMVVPGDMKLVKIVDKRSQLIVDKRTQDRMQIVKMCCTHRCTASSVRQHVCAKPEEMKQILEFLVPQRGAGDRRRHISGSSPF